MSKNTKAIILAGFIVGAVTILLIISMLGQQLTPIPDGTVGNTSGNSYNSGLFAEQDGVVYFANPYDSGSLYKMNADETNVKEVLHGNVTNINVGGNYVFYFENGTSGQAGLGYLINSTGIFRCDLDGNNTSNLARDVVFNMQLVGNDLYYLSSDSNGALFYKLSFDRSEKTLIANEGINFSCALSNGLVYYNGDSTNHYLYSYNTVNGSTQTVWEGNLWYPVYDNGYIYYLDVANNYRLCRYSISGDVIEVLTDDRIDCYNIADGYIYYQKNSTTDPEFRMMTLDGQNVSTLMTGNYTAINVTSKYVYFQQFGSTVPVYKVPVGGSTTVTTFDAASEAALSK